MAKLALRGGIPVRTRPWPAWPVRGEAERRNLLDAFENSQWGGFPEPQPRADELARRFTAYQDAAHGVCCSNGSISLEICLKAAGITAGDEVIVPCTTWVATGVSPVRVNAVPVFVDVDPVNYCIDPKRVEEAITPKTRAIIPVHLGSSIADLDRLTEICARHHLVLIEDCAHAHGCRWRGKGVGSWGDFGSFSFQSSKILTSGEGGFITAKDALAAQKVHSLVNCGRKDPSYNEFPGQLLGYNARLTELQAAILLGQLDRAEELRERKEKSALYLASQLQKLGAFSAVPADPRETRRGYYQLIFKYHGEAFQGLPRDTVLAALEKEGVDFDGLFYPPMPFSPLFAATTADWPMLRERYGNGIQAPETLRKFSFPVGMRFAHEEGVWVHYPFLLGEQTDLDDIVTAVDKVMRHCDELK